MVFGLNLAPLGPLLAPLGSLGWLGGVGWTLLDYCKYQRFRADAFILHHVLLCYARGPLWDPSQVLQIPCIWALRCLQGPLGTLLVHFGAVLGTSLGSPRGLPEPLWGLPVPPRDTPGALCVLLVTLPGLPGDSPEPF